MVQKMCKIWANFGNVCQKCAVNILQKWKVKNSSSKKGKQVNSWKWTTNSYLKNLKHGKGLSLHI